MDVKMRSYEVAKWLKEERSTDPDFHGTREEMVKTHSCWSRAAAILVRLRCGKYNFMPDWFTADWKINVSKNDWRNADAFYGVIHYCVHSTKSGKTYFKMPATTELVEVIEKRLTRYKTDDGMFILPLDDESQLFCPPETNGYFNPDPYLQNHASSDAPTNLTETVKTMWNIAKNVVGTNDEEDKSKEDEDQTITEVEKYKTALKALVMAYSKYSKRNPEQIMHLMLKKAEENYNEVNQSYEFWVKLNNDIDGTEKVDIR